MGEKGGEKEIKRDEEKEKLCTRAHMALMPRRQQLVRNSRYSKGGERITRKMLKGKDETRDASATKMRMYVEEKNDWSKMSLCMCVLGCLECAMYLKAVHLFHGLSLKHIVLEPTRCLVLKSC